MNEKLLKFYKVMNYTIPKNYYIFIENYIYNKNLSDNNIILDNSFSWYKKNKYLDEYIDYINKYGFLYRQLPFVRQIFLSNSITFNSLNSNSDIDLFVICKEKRLWLCRFFAYLIFFIFRISWNF